ncbi:MAG TPA: preprotein translocase subunit YajC [Polyangiales bacterium]|nr:preprotein translocase subunit YajC [Polyangiales bacterium]
MQALFLMQPEATSGGTTQPDGGPAPQNAPSGGAPGGESLQLLLLPLMFVLFYFLMIRPQQKRQREMDDLLKALRRGDVVRTSGGIRGEIVDITDADVTLLIADKVKINVLRSHIASKGDTAKADAKGEAKAKT